VRSPVRFRPPGDDEYCGIDVDAWPDDLVDAIEQCGVERGRLGVVDGERVGFAVQELGIGAAAHAGVQGVDRRHLVGREREVEDVEVLRDAVGLVPAIGET
jgi:hypothetical protein